MSTKQLLQIATDFGRLSERLRAVNMHPDIDDFQARVQRSETQLDAIERVVNELQRAVSDAHQQ